MCFSDRLLLTDTEQLPVSVTVPLQKKLANKPEYRTG